MKKCSEESCKEGCEGEWYCCYPEILQYIRINSYVYADADGDLITRNRGKFRNMIVGPPNCRKTYMLKQLEHIFHAFCNPANDNYSCYGEDKAEVIVLQDLRWRRLTDSFGEDTCKTSIFKTLVCV